MRTVFEHMFSRVWLYQLCWVAMAVSQRTPHTFQTLTNARLQAVSQCSSNVQSLFNTDLPRILKERVPDTPGHAEVKEYIIARLNQLKCSRWKITLDTFTDTAPDPFGEKQFTNIIATLDPDVDKRLVLAAHYDSKHFKKGSFVGATDSAVPVALLLDLALTLDDKLCNRRRSDYSLQIILFDGEEAFIRWTSTDSIYGSRHLAAEMAKQGGLLSVGDKTGLEAMEALILLDLIGSINPYPKFYDMQKSGSKLFQRLAKIEKRLAREGHLQEHTSDYLETKTSHGFGGVEDDHIPFLHRGVPIVHLIPVPFPQVWHTLEDNGDAIDEKMVTNFKKILAVFLHEYFDLR